MNGSNPDDIYGGLFNGPAASPGAPDAGRPRHSGPQGPQPQLNPPTQPPQPGPPAGAPRQNPPAHPDPAMQPQRAYPGGQGPQQPGPPQQGPAPAPGFGPPPQGWQPGPAAPQPTPPASQPPIPAETPAAGRGRLRSRISAQDFDTPQVETADKPRRGWRRGAYAMGLHFVKPSATEILENQQIRRISSPGRGAFVVGVLNHKSSGKTTISTGVGSTMAKYRGIGKAFAIDADIAFGNMAERVAHPPTSSFRELLRGGDELPSASVLRQHVGMTNAGLWMVGGETDTAPTAQAMTPEELHQLVAIAKQWCDVIFLDCTNDLRTPMVQAVLSEANAVIVPAAMRLDSVRGALTTLDHLEEAGYTELVRQAIVVLSDIYNGGSDNKVRRRLEAKFGSTVRAIRALEFDPHVAQAGPIEIDQMTLANQLALTDIASLLAELFAAAADRGVAQRMDGGSFR